MFAVGRPFAMVARQQRHNVSFFIRQADQFAGLDQILGMFVVAVVVDGDADVMH
jgi:hypothetical protein